MASETQPLTAIVAKIIETRRHEVRINPSWIATEALLEIDPDKQSVPLVYLGCHLELRQIARGLLRQHFEDPPSPADDAIAQHDLFPDLQRRYPSARSKEASEPEYVLLDEMSDSDIWFNVERLRKEGTSKLRHADALEAFGLDKTAAAA
jgi:hypothetical protein